MFLDATNKWRFCHEQTHPRGDNLSRQERTLRAVTVPRILTLSKGLPGRNISRDEVEVARGGGGGDCTLTNVI